MKKIFISYSRLDSDFVRRLVIHLENAGLSVWLDADDLVPGTPNWEQAIRNAIDNAEAVLLIASPDSRQSVYVQGELTLAQLRQCPVYPIWANGDAWIESIPLGMVNYQYIDCREENFETGVQLAIKNIQTIINAVGNTITLSVASHERVQLGLEQFKTSFELVNHIYLNYLQNWYAPLTYGVDWILANIETRRLAVPWEWLDARNSDNRATFSFPSWYAIWGDLSPNELDIENDSIWAVWEVQRLRIGGIAVNNPNLHYQLLSKFGQRELRLLTDNGCLKQIKSDETMKQDFKFKTIIALMSLYKNNSIFIEQPENCDSASLG